MASGVPRKAFPALGEIQRQRSTTIQEGDPVADTSLSRLSEAIAPVDDEGEKFGPLHAIPAKAITLESYAKILIRPYGSVLPAEMTIGVII